MAGAHQPGTPWVVEAALRQQPQSGPAIPSLYPWSDFGLGPWPGFGLGPGFHPQPHHLGFAEWLTFPSIIVGLGSPPFCQSPGKEAEAEAAASQVAAPAGCRVWPAGSSLVAEEHTGGPVWPSSPG